LAPERDSGTGASKYYDGVALNDVSESPLEILISKRKPQHPSTVSLSN
jgi:hypothetical protein